MLKSIATYVNAFVILLPSLAFSSPNYEPIGERAYWVSQGYQQFKIADDLWFVLYQGNRDTPQSWVENAWRLRSAELCKSSGSNYFVELRYSFETITSNQPKYSISENQGWLMHTAGVSYIPIFIPNNSGNQGLEIRYPSKSSTIMCVRNLDHLLDRSRAVKVDDVIVNIKK